MSSGNTTFSYNDFSSTKDDVNVKIKTKKNTKFRFPYWLLNMHINALVRRKRDMAALNTW